VRPGYNAAMADNDSARCLICGGTGWTIVMREGREVAVRCSCRRERGREAHLRACRIPTRYAQCTVDGFEIWARNDPSLGVAKRRTREFIELFPRSERGLLFMGGPGCGKTHLAVGALREVVAKGGVRGLYANFVELIQELQMTFDGGGRPRDEIINPVLEADCVVLDELGAGRTTPWVLDVLYYVINARYMSRRTTLFTTNFTVFPPDGQEGALRRTETLADRITAPLCSRVWEMCDLVHIRCGDYRMRNAPERARSS